MYKQPVITEQKKQVSYTGYTCPMCGGSHNGTYQEFMNQVCKGKL